MSFASKKSSNIKKTLLGTTVAVGLALCNMPAQAAGFFLQEGSSSSAGASNAGAAAMPRDASIIFHNPSAMTYLDGAQVNGAVHFLYTHAELEDQASTVGTFPAAAVGLGDDGGNPGGLQPLPNLYGAAPIGMNGNLWAGIGVTTPFGLGPEYDEDFFGSFLVTQAELQVIDITPSLSYRVNDYLSVGISGIIQSSDLNYQFFSALNEISRITADDVAYGYKLSATLTPTDKITVGAQYRSRTNLDFEGDIDGGASLGVPAAGADASGTLNLPDMANLAVAYDWNDKWTIMGGLDWYGWGVTDTAFIDVTGPTPTLPVTFAYENTLNFNIGAEYRHSDKWTFRGGYQFDETPTTAEGRSALNPDGDRHWFSGGATQTLNEKWSIDYAATYIDIEDGNINRDIAPGTSVVGQATDSYALIGTIGVNYKF